jgi:sarcosine oxidase gamma subunit
MQLLFSSRKLVIMNKTERYFWDTEHCEVITSTQLREEYDSKTSLHETFDDFMRACCDKNGTLQLLHKGPGQFSSDGGNDVGAVLQFNALLQAMCGSEVSGRSVQIVVDGYTLEAYDHAALMQGLIDAISYFTEEIC